MTIEPSHQRLENIRAWEIGATRFDVVERILVLRLCWGLDRWKVRVTW